MNDTEVGPIDGPAQVPVTTISDWYDETDPCRTYVPNSQACFDSTSTTVADTTTAIEVAQPAPQMLPETGGELVTAVGAGMLLLVGVALTRIARHVR